MGMKHQLLHGDITDRILRCAVKAHRELGPGLPELSYQRAMSVAMKADSLRFVAEPTYELRFLGASIGCHRPDFVVEEAVIVELKAVKQLEPSAAKQMLAYLRVSGLRVGLLINFNAPVISLGVKRFVL